MAASDPTTDVPTPTGTLQGVAAFSWDGSAWQPVGRAGPAVATPTGVLRGVAAFNGGSPWQPSGRAQPGVATPSGVLDGVAVYTWSGSAWTPAGGTVTPSTPSGALRGVAAFNWDGAAWQPASQAGPSVATPYGVLDGVAMFGWTGSAWAATGASSLSLDFMSPGTLPAGVIFARAGTATYFNSAGVMQSAATNAPRWDYDPNTLTLRGLLIEEARTNLLLPSVPAAGTWSPTGPVQALGGSAIAPDGTTTTTSLIAASDTTASVRRYTPANVAITAGATYTVSVFLKTSAGNNAFIELYASGGTAADSVGYYDLTAGTALVGSDLTPGLTNRSVSIAKVGAWYRVSYTFTNAPNNTALSVNVGPCTTFTASGDYRAGAGTIGQGIYVWGAMVEQGAFATSYIPTTAAAVTRAVDSCSIPSGNMGWFTGPGGSWSAEFIDIATVLAYQRVILLPPGPGSIGPVAIDNTMHATQLDGTGGPSTANTITLGAVSKVASTYVSGTGRVCLNGGAIASGAMTAGYAGASSTGLQIMCVPAATTENMSGYMRRLRYWPRVLSDAELQAVTS